MTATAKRQAANIPTTSPTYMNGSYQRMEEI